MSNGDKDKVDCFNCVHFVVTWQPSHPRACRVFGFKGMKMPSIAVEESSGAPCVAFERKQKKK